MAVAAAAAAHAGSASSSTLSLAATCDYSSAGVNAFAVIGLVLRLPSLPEPGVAEGGALAEGSASFTLKPAASSGGRCGDRGCVAEKEETNDGKRWAMSEGRCS